METKEYYKTYITDFWNYTKSGVNWKNGGFALLSLFMGAGYYLIANGWNAMVEQTVNFIAFTLAPLGFLTLFFLLTGLIQTPVRIHQSQKSEFTKSLKEKEFEFEKVLKGKDFELEKYSWNNVDFWVTSFSIIGKSGWAFKVANKKPYDISKILVEITKIRKDEKNIRQSGLHLLGYIDRQRGKIGEKIVNSYTRGGINSGESREFVVTSEVKKTKASKTHKFETYPDKLEWDFPIETVDNVSTTMKRSALAMAVALYGTSNAPPEPITVIEVCVRAEIKIDDEIIQLPGKFINLLVRSNGSLAFYDDMEKK
jgi:hypothetical protein